MTGNTILITGGGSGIGKGLAAKFHESGNVVIIAGRNMDRLNAVAAEYPGILAMQLDVGDAQSISTFARDIAAAHPALNVVINNAGIMITENMQQAPSNIADADNMVITNLLGTIRLSSALLPHLLAQPAATLMTVSSGLAFVPLAITPTYSATKAAVHSWSVATREQLKNTSVEVIELAPPYVQTELMSAAQASDPNVMPLGAFIDEVMAILSSNPADGEVIVENCKPLRFAAENGTLGAVFDGLNAAYN